MSEARNIAEPQPGFFKLRRRIKSEDGKIQGYGPWLPARIGRFCHCTINGGDESNEHAWQDTCDRYPPLAAEIDGKPVDVYVVWTSGEDIDAAEYRYMLERNEWDRKYAPDSPAANPNRAIDINKLPAITP